jgi:hypothetical protein
MRRFLSHVSCSSGKDVVNKAHGFVKYDDYFKSADVTVESFSRFISKELVVATDGNNVKEFCHSKLTPTHDAGLQKRTNFSTLIVGLAGTGDRNGSGDNRSAIYYNLM